jgi:hypothetical protein
MEGEGREAFKSGGRSRLRIAYQKFAQAPIDRIDG